MASGMKTKDIAAGHGFNLEDFESFLRQNKYDIGGILSNSLSTKDAVRAIEEYSKFLTERKEKENERLLKEEAKQKAIAAMLVTSGFSFDGYTIKKYSGYISGDDAIQIDRDNLFDGQGQHLTDSLVKIRIQALKELKEAAYDLGCNAVIGVDFDYMTFEPETISHDIISGSTHVYEPYIVCVTANGNAVLIEKN